MTAATADISTPEIKFPRFLAAKLTVLNAAVLYAGAMLAVDYADEAQPAADTAGLKVLGRCPLGLDNADDGLETAIEQGIFQYANSATYPVPRSAIGQVCYVADDNTVAGWSTNLVPAGLVYDVDDNGVWVNQRPAALAAAWERRPVKRVAKTDDYACTAAIAFEGRTFFNVQKSSLATITLPSAVAGMRIGVQRGNAGAGYDVSVQAATGDKVQGSDGLSAAAKKIDNTVDAISDILWLRAVDDTNWMIDNPYPGDVTSWVKNDA
jgi:hypothetical protein